jgi:hypothetical protein
MCLSTRPTSKWHFVPKLPNGSPKIPKVGSPTTLGRITLCADLRLKRSLKQSFSPHWKLFNGMLQTTCTQENRVDSPLLMVKSQIANLTPDFSFGHNLCFRCLNGSCEPILNIYVSIAFQWYNEVFNPIGFDLYNCFIKIQESTRTDALLNPLEGPSVLNYGNMELGGAPDFQH